MRPCELNILLFKISMQTNLPKHASIQTVQSLTVSLIRRSWVRALAGTDIYVPVMLRSSCLLTNKGYARHGASTRHESCRMLDNKMICLQRGLVVYRIHNYRYLGLNSRKVFFSRRWVGTFYVFLYFTLKHRLWVVLRTFSFY